MKLPECGWCTAPAVGTVHAQWTIFDFDDAVACEEHMLAAQSMFWRRWVDNFPPADVWITFWDVDNHVHALEDSP